MFDNNQQPLFIHINSCGGRYIRSKFCEKYNDNFIVYHINPRLWKDIVPRSKIVRCWKYRDPTFEYSTPLLKYPNISILDLNNTIPFIILRDPILRYKSENKSENNNTNDNTNSYNIMCKTLYIAFTGDYNEYFVPFTESKYNNLLKFITNTKNIIIIPINKINLLANYFSFKSVPSFIDNNNNNNILTNNSDNNKENLDFYNNNIFDYLLYNKYK